MRKIHLTTASLILMSTVTLSVSAWGTDRDIRNHPPLSITGTESSPGEEIVHSSLASLCPDIADTQPFREAGLGYVHSVEFARSVFAVASGTSRYSPREIPVNWRAAAYGWWTHVATAAKAGIRYIPVETESLTGTLRRAGTTTTIRPRIQTTIGRQINWEKESLGKDSCDPQLLFRASLDYREKSGQDDLPLAFPYRVRTAADTLGRTISAKYEAASRLAARADSIHRRITDAERMGAAICQPNELARVRAEWEEAVNVATDIQRTLEDAEVAFARAEESSAELLAQRQYASSLGIPCFQN